MPAGYIYIVRMAPAAITTAKTLIQIKAGERAIDILEAKIYQVTKTTIELQQVQLLRKSAAATVTATTPLKFDTGDPPAAALGGTAATGTNASAEGTDTDITYEHVWNVAEGTYSFSDALETKPLRVEAGEIFGLKLATAPAASQTTGALVKFIEYLPNA